MTTVKELKRTAQALGIETSGCEKADLVREVKRAKLERAGHAWQMDPQCLAISVNFEFEPMPHDERVYALRHQLINMFHRPEEGKRLLAVSKEDFLNAPEWAETKENAEMYVGPGHAALREHYEMLADATAGAKPVAVKVNWPVMYLADEEDEKGKDFEVEPSTPVLQLADNKELKLFQAHVETWIGPSGIVTLQQLVDGIEKNALEVMLDDHKNGRGCDVTHPCCEFKTRVLETGVEVGVYWGS